MAKDTIDDIFDDAFMDQWDYDSFVLPTTEKQLTDKGTTQRDRIESGDTLLLSAVSLHENFATFELPLKTFSTSQPATSAEIDFDQSFSTEIDPFNFAPQSSPPIQPGLSEDTNTELIGLT